MLWFLARAHRGDNYFTEEAFPWVDCEVLFGIVRPSSCPDPQVLPNKADTTRSFTGADLGVRKKLPPATDEVEDGVMDAILAASALEGKDGFVLRGASAGARCVFSIGLLLL